MEDRTIYDTKFKSSLELIITLAQYPYVLKDSLNCLDAHSIIEYLFKVCQIISIVHQEVWVMGQSPEVAEARILLYHTARIVLNNALKLIGLRPVEKM